MIILRDLPNEAELTCLAKRYPGMDRDSAGAFLAFLRAACEVFHAADAHFVRIGTSCGRFTVLALLNRDPDRALTPSRIADACGVTRATVTGLLDGLEKDGLVQRSRDRSDRRTQQIQLTTAGRRFLDAMMPGHFRRIAQLMDGISDRDRDALRRIATHIAANASSLITSEPPRPR